MKGNAVIILLAISVLVSALVFGNKYNNEIEDIDSIEHSLAAINSIVPVGATIGYQSFPNDIELFGKARFVLAPTNITLAENNSTLDTILSIQTIGNDDSLLKVFLTHRAIIYEQADSNYKYYISTNR